MSTKNSPWPQSRTGYFPAFGFVLFQATSEWVLAEELEKQERTQLETKMRQLCG